MIWKCSHPWGQSVRGGSGPGIGDLVEGEVGDRLQRHL
jgi:hypothetical protein